jgi:hypothetical protein
MSSKLWLEKFFVLFFHVFFIIQNIHYEAFSIIFLLPVQGILSIPTHAFATCVKSTIFVIMDAIIFYGTW